MAAHLSPGMLVQHARSGLECPVSDRAGVNALQVPVKTPPRQILLNDSAWSETAKFRPNVIFTAKYNFLTFLPKFLMEQFMRLANFYFLVISVIQVCPA